MKPHKHAELIKAWADGAEIECKFKSGNWRTVEYPDWANPLEEYRIKPEEKKPVVRWKCVYENTHGYLCETEYFYTDEEIKQCKGYTRLEYTRTEFEK